MRMAPRRRITTLRRQPAEFIEEPAVSQNSALQSGGNVFVEELVLSFSLNIVLTGFDRLPSSLEERKAPARQHRSHRNPT